MLWNMSAISDAMSAIMFYIWQGVTEVDNMKQKQLVIKVRYNVRYKGVYVVNNFHHTWKLVNYKNW